MIPGKGDFKKVDFGQSHDSCVDLKATIPVLILKPCIDENTSLINSTTKETQQE